MRDLPLYRAMYVKCPQTGFLAMLASPLKFYTSSARVAFDSRLCLIAFIRAIADLYFDCVADFARF